MTQLPTCAVPAFSTPARPPLQVFLVMVQLRKVRTPPALLDIAPGDSLPLNATVEFTISKDPVFATAPVVPGPLLMLPLPTIAQRSTVSVPALRIASPPTGYCCAFPPDTVIRASVTVPVVIENTR